MLSYTTVIAQQNCGSVIFPAPAEILSNVPEANGYNLVYHLPIPLGNSDWDTQAQIPYSENNTAALAPIPYTRVAYYVKLYSSAFGTQWVWASFDAHTTDVTKVGLPTGSDKWQQIVNNMNVMNYQGVNKTGISGNIEFWSNGYDPTNSSGVTGASDATYDFGDAPTLGDNVYGSFQVHDFAAQTTLFAYNAWSYPGGGPCDDLGINNQPFGNPDWTFAGNACLYDIRELYVFVNTTPCPPPPAAHFFPTAVDCAAYQAGATALSNVCYKTTANTVTNAIPGVFFYYTKIKAPAVLGVNGSFCVDVVQTKACAGFKYYGIQQGNQIRAWDLNCNKIVQGLEISPGQGRVCITGATPGKDYIISVKYEPKSLIGSTWAGPTPPTCENSFVTKLSASGSVFGSGADATGSQGTLQAIPNCSVTGRQATTETTEITGELKISALVNPASSYFSLNIQSNNEQKITVRILNKFGKVMVQNAEVFANSTVRIGYGLPGDVYFAEAVQGNQRKLIKVVKLN